MAAIHRRLLTCTDVFPGTHTSRDQLFRFAHDAAYELLDGCTSWMSLCAPKISSMQVNPPEAATATSNPS